MTRSIFIHHMILEGSARLIYRKKIFSNALLNVPARTPRATSIIEYYIGYSNSVDANVGVKGGRHYI